MVTETLFLMYTDPCTFAMNTFNFYLESLPQFIIENDADWCMIYEWMEDMCGPLRDEHWEEVAQVYQEFNNDTRV